MHICKVFKQLAEPRAENRYISNYFITEKSIRNNFESVFGHKCDIFARVIYLKLAGMKDYSKINFVRFFNLFINVLDENKDNNLFFDYE